MDNDQLEIPHRTQQFVDSNLYRAIRRGNLPALELLLEHGANPNFYDEIATPLLISVGHETLFRNDDKLRFTEIEEATKNDDLQVEIIKILVAAGAEIETVVAGETALSVAIKNYNPRQVETLLELGADRSQVHSQIDQAQQQISSFTSEEQRTVLLTRLREIELLFGPVTTK